MQITKMEDVNKTEHTQYTCLL